MKRKMIVVLICIFMLMITGCSSDSGSNSSQSSNAGQSSKGTGKKQSVVDATFMRGENPVQPVNPKAPILDTIEQKTHVRLKVEALSGSNYGDKKNALIATNSMPDILGVSNTDIQQYARTGIFLPISDYMQYLPHFKKLIADRPEVNKLKVDGKLYGFPILQHYRIGVAPQAMIRTDLLKKNNLPIPTTFDQFFNDLKALKSIYPDKIPFTTRNGTIYMLGQLAYPMGSGGFAGFSGNPVYYEPTLKKYVYGPSTDKFKNVVSYVNKMYEDGLLDPDYAVNTKDMAFEKLSSGKALAYFDNNTFAARNFNPALKKIDPNAKIEMLPPMKNSYGETRSYRYQRDWLTDNYAISSKVKNPIPLLKMFDWMYSNDGTMTTNFGVEGQDYVMNNGSPVIKQSLIDKYKNKSDSISAIRSAIGLGQLAFAVNVDETWDASVTDPYMVQMGKEIDNYTKEGKIQYMTYDPPFTKDETEQLKKLESKVNTDFQEQIDKFIMGKRPMSEYDTFAKKLNDDGAQQIAKIYNDALNRINK